MQRNNQKNRQRYSNQIVQNTDWRPMNILKDAGLKSLTVGLVCSLLALTACPTNPAPPSPPPAPPSPPAPPPPPVVTYRVSAQADKNDFSVSLYRTGESTPVSSATVTMNGLTLTFTPYGYYYVRPTPDLTPGANVELRITVPEGVITANSTLPDTISLTAPAEGASISVSSLVNITWTSPSNPSEFRLTYAVAGDSVSYSLGVAAGGARSFTVPAGTLPANTRLICVYAVNSGTNTLAGPASSDSKLEVDSNYACANLTAMP
jgi:hypothetical protein